MSAAEKAAAIITGALITGIGWKIRGATGWGSSWGLLCVGFFFAMYIFVLSGGAKRHSTALPGIIGFSFMFTAPAWGTINTQILGIIPGAEVTDMSLVEINPLSGAFLLLLLGYGTATLFALAVGVSFSGKSYKLWHFAVIIVLFFVFDYISRAFVSPFILRLVQPQAERLFDYGLQNAGYDMTAQKAFVTNMFDMSWAKGIVGGRNYFASIKSITSALRSVLLIVTIKYIFKDKTTARIMNALCSIFAFSILAADIFIYISGGGFQSINIGFVLKFLAEGWSLWEYFTGFIAGGLMTSYILRQIKNQCHIIDNTHVLENHQRYRRFETVVTFVFTVLLCVGVSSSRAIISRLTNTNGIELPQQIALTSAAAILPCLIIAALMGFGLEKVGAYKLCAVALPCVLSLHMIIYFVIGDKSCAEWRHFSHSAIPELVLFSWILFLLLYFILYFRRFSVKS